MLIDEYDKRAVWERLLQSDVVFAAEGPYIAERAQKALDIEVGIVSQDYSSFQGLVAALEQHFG